MTPSQVKQIIADFQDGVRKKILNELIDLLKNNGNIIYTRQDPYYGYPSVYGEDARCSIMQLRYAYISKAGNLMYKTDSGDDPGCFKNIPTYELLQVWDILLRNQGTTEN